MRDVTYPSPRNGLLLVAAGAAVVSAITLAAAIPLQANHARAVTIGARMSTDDFVSSSEFRSAVAAGRISSRAGGSILFDTGVEVLDADASGQPNEAFSSQRNDGDPAFCLAAGEFTNGAPRLDCVALHDGVVERISNLPTEQH